MTKEAVRRKGEPARVHHVTRHEGNGLGLVASYLPEGSPQREVAGIAVAAGGALLAAAVLGVGPAALAGAAGYMVYREAHRA